MVLEAVGCDLNRAIATVHQARVDGQVAGALEHVGDDNATGDLSSQVETADGGLRWGV